MSDDVLRRLVDGCVDDRSGEFGGFYRPFLAECAQAIQAWDPPGETGRGGFVDLPQIAGTLLRAVMDAYCRTGVRTLISAFRSRQDDSACATMGYDEFHTWLSGAEGRQRLLDLYPELGRLLRLTAERHLAHAQQVLHAAWQDRADLDATYDTSGPIVSLVPGLGDSHRGGLTVSSLRWHNGVTVIHKPQQESAQPLLEAVRDLADQDGSFFGPLLPRTVVRPGHLWQERVVHADVDEALGAAGYFRRFGRAAALLSMMGATDLHHENVLATSAGPVVIDTETLVSLPGHHGAGGAGALGRETEASVLNTMLFSTRFSGATLDVDMSAVGCIRPADSRRILTHRVVDAGTDGIRFDQVPATAPHGPNMATLDGEPLDPRLWSDQITEGFHEARERLRTHRRAIEDTVERQRGWSVRQVLRPTYVYARFLDASTHPAYLGSTGTRTALLSKLPRRHRGIDGTEAGEALCHAEAEQLVDLDIPFFDVPCDAREVRGDHGEPVTTDTGRAAAVGSTPREAVLRAVRDFFERPAVRDPAYIGYALGSSVDDVWEERRTPVRSGHCPDLADAGGWHAVLAGLVVSREEEPTWLMPKLDGDGLRLGSVNTPLHEGGGLMLYLAEAGRTHGAPLIGADPGAVYAAAMPRELPKTTAPLDFSPFTGALSSVVTGLELLRRGADQARIPLPDLPMGDLDVRGLTLEDFDYLNGFGGYLLYRAEYADEARLPATGPDTGPLLERLVELDGPPDAHRGPLGLAHGRFGRIAAMSALVLRGADPSGRAAEHLAAFASSYLRDRWTDEALREERSAGGWCKGHAGVAFAAAKALRSIGFSPQRTRDAIAPEVERVITGDLRPDISFCHGLAGRLAMLCWLADHLDWPQLRSEAVALNDRFLDRYGEGGWTFGIGSVTDLPSFLYGRSGLYYAQLMLRDESVRLPLCLGGR
ncbi:type 2 lanthipeptide synthetase LanM [Streptomyces virginiae]|uniref:type 2 lanthipeptide synthetase LanM n=1 Tax=Streptomyces virginiae TaxID=1961 RepID=UPI0036A0DBA8